MSRAPRTQEHFAAGGFRVDDLAGIRYKAQIEALAKTVDEKYGITGLGEVKWVLGMLLERDRSARTVSISHAALINSILAQFNLMDALPLSTPLAPGTPLSTADCLTTQEEMSEMATRPYRGLVGALSWLALDARLDIAFSTSSLARFGHNPGRVHWETAKYCATSREPGGGVLHLVGKRRRSLAIRTQIGGAIVMIAD